jgi:WD40 repeat protein
MNSLLIDCCHCNNSPLSLFVQSFNYRKLLVLDAVTGGISRNIDSGHDRNIHCIALPQPSVHVPISQLAYNIFATAATDNVISLWDLRTPRSTSRLTSHINRREKCQCSFSPCLRYLTTASEDRSARIFDIRLGKEVVKLGGQHRDVVSSVAYHPIHPQLVTASYDGSVKCYVGDEI